MFFPKPFGKSGLQHPQFRTGSEPRVPRTVLTVLKGVCEVPEMPLWVSGDRPGPTQISKVGSDVSNHGPLTRDPE